MNLQAIEQQKNFELAKMAVEFVKTGDPKLASRLATMGAAEMPESVQAIYMIADRLKTDPDKALGALMDEVTGASKVSANHQNLVNQTARSLLQYYGGDMEKATAAAEATLSTGKLPEGLEPIKGDDGRTNRIADLSLDILAKWRMKNPGLAVSIATVLSDPLATEEDKAAIMAPLANLKTLDDERLADAQQQINIALKNLELREGGEKRSERVREKLTKILIATSDPRTGEINFAAARSLATGESFLGMGKGEDLPAILDYIDDAQRNREIFADKSFRDVLMMQMMQGFMQGQDNNVQRPRIPIPKAR
jgi:hypothetical protein